MAISRVETVNGIFSGSTIVATLGTPTTAGELVVLAIGIGNNGNIPTTITDNQGQTYTLVAEISGAFGGHFYCGIYYKENSAAGVTSVTVTPNGDVTGGVIASHYTGVATSASLDQKSSMTSVGLSPFASGNITTVNANDLLVTCDYSQLDTGSQTNPVWDSPWTEPANGVILSSPTFDGNNGNSLSYADQIVSATGTYHGSGVDGATGVSGGNLMAVSSFEAAGGSPPGAIAWIGAGG
jgi:hypothetical protein